MSERHVAIRRRGELSRSSLPRSYPAYSADLSECVTDNPARTSGRVKELLAKGGGRVSAVGFLFERKGVVRVAPIEEQEGATFDALFEAALEGGAEDVREVESEDGMLWEVSHASRDPSLSVLEHSPPVATVWLHQYPIIIHATQC